MRHECRVYKPDGKGQLQLKNRIAPKPVFTKKELAQLKKIEIQKPSKEAPEEKESPASEVCSEDILFSCVRGNYGLTTFAAQVWNKQKRRLEYLGTYKTQEAAAQAAANYKGCAVEDLLKTKKTTRQINERPVSKYRCVMFREHCRNNPWSARVNVAKSLRAVAPNGQKSINLGAHKTELAAAQAVANFKGCSVEDLRK